MPNAEFVKASQTQSWVMKALDFLLAKCPDLSIFNSYLSLLHDVVYNISIASIF